MGGGGDLDISAAWGGSSSNKWIAGFLTRRTIMFDMGMDQYLLIPFLVE
jgi:hypothetical protein